MSDLFASERLVLAIQRAEAAEAKLAALEAEVAALIADAKMLVAALRASQKTCECGLLRRPCVTCDQARAALWTDLARRVGECPQCNGDQYLQPCARCSSEEKPAAERGTGGGA